MPARMFRIAALALAVAALPASVGAQDTAAPVATAVSPDAPPPPYEPQLLRLSEIMGAIHYLRPLCGYDEKDLWRAEMEAFLDIEQAEEPRRRRIVDSFNRGYESFRSVYRTCTAAASASADRYVQEGAKIAGEIVARYGK